MADSTINLGAKAQPQYKRWGLPAWLVFICVVTFTVLLSAGAVIYKNAPPIPDKVVSSQQEIILTHDQIEHGQVTYLGRGGQHIGSIWGDTVAILHPIGQQMSYIVGV